MNYNKNVVVFTLVSTSILLLYSVYAAVTNTDHLGLNNVSILSDVLKSPVSNSDSTVVDSAIVAAPTAKDSVMHPAYAGERSLSMYTSARAITSFATDTAVPALPRLMHKLQELKAGKKSRIRIAWLGDSMIEGDLLTQTFRKRMQEYFGGYGVGFIPATSVTAAFRTTVNHKWTGDWREQTFKDKELSAPLFFSGHVFFTGNGSVQLTDRTVKDSTQPLEKVLVCGHLASDVAVTVNGRSLTFKAPLSINRIPLDNSVSHSISVAVQSDQLPVYGISLEPQSGIVVDNFSFRGITGLELAKFDSTFLHTLDKDEPYDLVVLEYGANLLFRPNDVDYSWYYKHIVPVLQYLQRSMPHAEFLIISTADRAFRYDDVWKTAIGIDNLVKTQAELAFTNQAAFYNMYASMGGQGTVVRWADSTPSLANKDYIHPNLRGAEILGNMLFDAFMHDMDKAARTQHF